MATTAVLSTADTVVADPAEFDWASAEVVFLEQYRRRRELYERLYGTVRYDRQTRGLTIRAHRVRAIMTPPLFGAAMYKVLGYRRLPIYTVGTSDTMRWVFLTARPTRDDDVVQLEIELVKVPVTIVGPGVELALPTPGDTRRRWVCGLPDTTELPSYAEVATASVRSRRG